MPNLSDTIRRMKSPSPIGKPDKVVSEGEGLQVKTPEPNPNASPTFSQNFTAMLEPKLQQPNYQQTTVGAPSPIPSPLSQGLRQHMDDFGKRSESKKTKFRGY